MHISRKAASSAVVGAVLVAAGAGAGWAADSTGTITSCVTVNGGVMRFVESPQDCQPVERRVSWQANGTPGAPGPAGPVGPAGPAGKAGKDAATYAVKANGSGGIIKAPAGTTVSRVHQGRYDVTLPEDVSMCVATVSSTAMAQQSVLPQGRTLILQFQYGGYSSYPVDTEFSLAVLC